MNKRKQLGFTIVELLIVIVVIAILAAVTTFAYSGIQKRAQDSQIVNAAQQLQKAYSTATLNGKSVLYGGYSSTYNAGANTCSSGYGGWVDDTNYSYNPQFCTIATVLIAEKTVPDGLVKNLPKTNTVQTNYATGNKTMMFYKCTDTAAEKTVAITYSLNTPRPDQQTALENKCNAGASWAPFSTYGMNAGIVFTVPS